MARVSLDDWFFGSDKRLDFLSKLVNEPTYSVRGRLVQLFHLCYRKVSSEISSDEIDINCEWSGEKPFSDYLIRAGLAEKLENGLIKVRGVDKRIGYLISYRDRARLGGLKSGEVRRSKSEAPASFSSSKTNPIPNTTPIPTPIPKNTNTIDQNKFDRLIFDLEGLYKKYPRKLGKKKGIAKLKTIVRSKETYDLVAKAISNYEQSCRLEKKEEQFIMHFSTFVNKWEDYLDLVIEKPKPIFSEEYNKRVTSQLEKPFPETNPEILKLLRDKIKSI